MKTRLSLAPVDPWNQGEPVILGPFLHGASPGKPIHFAVGVRGERPLAFEAEGLPDGVRINPDTGLISGQTNVSGVFPVLLKVSNLHGSAEREWKLSIGAGLALTPPMGWNSWNAWRRWVDEEKVLAAGKALVDTGLAVRGFRTVNVDSCWQGLRGGPHQAIQPNGKFPDMLRLSRALHALGLNFGLYSTPWTVPWGCTAEEAEREWNGPGLIGCSSGDPDPMYRPNSIKGGRYIGVDKHEAQDVAQWVDWEIDYLKYDWAPTDPESTERMGKLLKSAPRDIILSLCTEARLKHAAAYKQWAQLWRGIPDTADHWKSLMQNAFVSEDYLLEDWRSHIGPGAWHDLDMMALGPQFHTQTSTVANQLTEAEQITHMTAWVMYPSPLLLSCDLTSLSDFEFRLFSNEEVLAINQDPLGRPAIRLKETRVQSLTQSVPEHQSRVWVKPLEDGSLAVAFFNLAEHQDRIEINLSEMGIPRSAMVRNVWERRDIGRKEGLLGIEVDPHGAQLLKVSF